MAAPGSCACPGAGTPASTGPRNTTAAGSCPARFPTGKSCAIAEVEPICKAYLELRYRLLPYLYSAVREAHETGMPVMRALWLHYPSDPEAVGRGDEYLWGRDILVAPVVEKGATSRTLYLPQGTWYDFWTAREVSGGREITRPVDLKTMPLYVRAGAIIPTGPVKQHTGETADAPLTLTVYPGADGTADVYEDDGASFAHKAGEYRKIAVRLARPRAAAGSDPRPGIGIQRPHACAGNRDQDRDHGCDARYVFDGTEQTIQF